MLSHSDFKAVLTILERIDSGLAQPNMPGELGRFLRQYNAGANTARAFLEKYRMQSRADGAVSGARVGTVSVHSISPVKESLLQLPLGVLAETLAFSEELGSTLYFRMWLKSTVADAAYNILRKHAHLTLSGDYRWAPPSRLTTGEAIVALCAEPFNWPDARCLKAVADDINRPPHALEFVLDYRLGPPGLKFFRTIAARRTTEGWQVLPAFGQLTPLILAESAPLNSMTVKNDALCMLLIYREPWSAEWTAVDVTPIDSRIATQHSITWCDHQYELRQLAMAESVAEGVRANLSALGFPQHDPQPVSISRRLLPLARDFLAAVRGLS